MPGSTTTFGFSYPLLSEAPNGAGEMQTLATQVDSSLSTVNVTLYASGLGRVGASQTFPAQSTMNSETLIVSATFTAVAGRRYRLKFGAAINVPNASSCGYTIRYATGGSVTTSGTQLQSVPVGSTDGWNSTFTNDYEYASFPAGTVTVGLFGLRAAGAGNCLFCAGASPSPPSYIFIDDVGT